jgi:hypothetical protein
MLNAFVYIVAPALGDMMVIVGGMIVKLGLLPLADGKPLEVTRARMVSDAGPVTVQLKVPLLGADAANSSKVLPPSRLTSMRTVSPAGKLWVQETFAVLPTSKLHAGAVTVSDGATTLKVASADAAGPVLGRAVTRTRALGAAAVVVHTHSRAVAGSPVHSASGV